MLPDGGFDALDRVEVAVLADKCTAERRDELGRVPTGAEEGSRKLAGLGDLLLAVEQVRQLLQQRLCVRIGVGGREPRCGDIEKPIEMDAHRRIEHTAEELL